MAQEWSSFTSSNRLTQTLQFLSEDETVKKWWRRGEI